MILLEMKLCKFCISKVCRFCWKMHLTIVIYLSYRVEKEVVADSKEAQQFGQTSSSPSLSTSSVTAASSEPEKPTLTTSQGSRGIAGYVCSSVALCVELSDPLTEASDLV